MLAHPLIEKTKAVLSGARGNDRGILWAGREVDWLDLRVSIALVDSDAFFSTTTLKPSSSSICRIVAIVRSALVRQSFVCGEQIRFGVMERSRQVKPVVPSTTSGYIYKSIKLEPTGILSIEVWNYYSRGPQKVWRDRDSARLEEQLPRCVAGMMRIALKQRAERKAREEEELAREKRIDEVEQELKRIEAEEKKIRNLKKDAVAWHRAERIRKCVAAVRDGAQKKADESERDKVLEWVTWAEQQADRMDPLKESPRSIVDDKEEVLHRLRSVRWGW